MVKCIVSPIGMMIKIASIHKAQNFYSQALCVNNRTTRMAQGSGLWRIDASTSTTVQRG
jgi:hypothetical protein